MWIFGTFFVKEFKKVPYYSNNKFSFLEKKKITFIPIAWLQKLVLLENWGKGFNTQNMLKLKSVETIHSMLRAWR